MISFIIPLFNHLEQTREMLESLWHTVPVGLDYEIILIDDGSKDGTRAWLGQMKHSKVRVMLNETNLGFAKTCNKAIQVAQGDILGLLNNDLVLRPGWLEPMLEILESPTMNAGLVGNVQHRIASDDAIDHAGVHVTCLGKLEHIQTLLDTPVGYQRVFAITGACFLVKKDDFKNAGGFDEEFVNGGEDIDLCLKIKQANKHLFVALQSHIGHHVSLTRDRASLSNERNSRRLQAKWRPELKREAAKQWVTKLHAQDIDSIDGSLAASFVAAPQLASRIIAENALLREESRWQRLLDHVEPNAGLASRCTALWAQSSGGKGASISVGTGEWVMALYVEGLRSACNFFVCGYRPSDMNQQDVATSVIVTVTVNGIQQKTFALGQESNFNIGLINPLVLPGIVNMFRVTVNHINASTGKSDGNACMPVVITHFVLDDERVLA